MTRTWLKELRGEKTLTRMAADLDISYTSLHQLEAGVYNPSVTRAKELAKKLNVHWTRFFEDDEKGA